MTNAASPPTPSEPKAGMKNSVMIRPMPSAISASPAKFTASSCNRIERQQQRERADDPRQHRAGL